MWEIFSLLTICSGLTGVQQSKFYLIETVNSLQASASTGALKGIVSRDKLYLCEGQKNRIIIFHMSSDGFKNFPIVFEE
jgi:hypothetical protein